LKGRKGSAAALAAWRSIPWDFERGERTLFLARLKIGTLKEAITDVLARAGGLKEESLQDLRIRIEVGSKRGRERLMSFVELATASDADKLLHHLKNNKIIKELGWVVDKARRGVDRHFVPHRFQGEYFWSKVDRQKKQNVNDSKKNHLSNKLSRHKKRHRHCEGN